MPPDVAQIALEHHRAGRYRQAEAGYRAALAADPQNPEAAHWLGVLIFQAGRADEALPLLRRAAAARPDDPAYIHNLAQACLSCGRADEAIATFDQALRLAPTAPRVLVGAAIARLARKSDGDAAAALSLLDQAAAAGLDSPELHQHRAIALLLLGRADEAIESCHKAIDANPKYAEAHYHLAVSLRQKQQLESARQSMKTALELRPDYLRACQGLAFLEAEAGSFSKAVELFHRAIDLNPDSAESYQGLGTVLRQMGRQDEAIQAFMRAGRALKGELSPSPARTTPISSDIAAMEQRLTPTPQMANLHFALAVQANVPSPRVVPPDAVSTLFDRYADRFDTHLVDRLEYRVPEELADAVKATIQKAGPRQLLDVLDLGCGTGLCGPLLRPIARRLSGVDLSSGMLEKARSRGVYDRLIEDDIVSAMHKAQKSFDLLVAADVLIYIGDLVPAFEAASQCLRAEGLFAFSVEAGQGDRYQLHHASRRFAHSKPYIQHLAQIFGFREELFTSIIARKEGGRPAPAWARRRSIFKSER